MKLKHIKSNPALNKLLTDAYYQSAGNALPTKKAQVETAFSSLVRDIGEVEPEVRYYMEVIASYLFSSNPPAPTNNYEWVARMAANRDDVEKRVWLKYVYANEDHIEATNGHIMGRVPNAGQLEPGYYVPFLMERVMPDTNYWSWPSTDRVISACRDETEQVLTRDSFRVEKRAKFTAWIVTHRGSEYAFDEHYMKLAFGHPSKQPPSQTFLTEGACTNLRLIWPDGSTVVVAAMRF